MLSAVPLILFKSSAGWGHHHDYAYTAYRRPLTPRKVTDDRRVDRVTATETVDLGSFLVGSDQGLEK